MKALTTFSVLVLSAASLYGACGGGDDNMGAGGAGGGSTGAGGANAGGVKRSPSGECPGAGNTCTQAENDAYGKCITDKCDGQYKMCLGNDYKSGKFGGPCGTYVTCASKCGCGDTACSQACGTPDMTCVNCLINLSPCALNSGCKVPACAGAPATGGGGASGGGGAGGSGGVTISGTCADLLKCCMSITDATKKMQCMMQHDQAKMAGAAGDTVCGIGYTVFKSSGVCK